MATQEEPKISTMKNCAAQLKEKQLKPWSLEADFLKRYDEYAGSKREPKESAGMQQVLLFLLRSSYKRLRAEHKQKQEEQKSHRQYLRATRHHRFFMYASEEPTRDLI